MTNEELTRYLIQQFPQAEIVMGNQYVEMTVAPEALVETAQVLKSGTSTLFDYLFCLSGVDYSEKLGVIYHIESTTLRHALVLKVHTTNRTEPRFDTLSDVWHTAKSHEREVFDLFGITFNNHIDLRRLFLDDDYGYPLRKDFTDQERIIAR
jgi:NADH:ubiquinone oxidoreductase subunit C